MADLFTWQALFFAFIVFVVVFIIRRIVQGFFPKLRKDTPKTGIQEYWENVILPILGPLVGAGMSFFVPDLIHPDISSVTAQAGFGLACGFVAPWAYSLIKFTMQKLFPGIKEPTGKEGDSWIPKANQDPAVQEPVSTTSRSPKLQPPTPLVPSSLPPEDLVEVPSTKPGGND